VVGETPNLAARIQGVAEAGMVAISDATRRLLGDLFVLRALGAQTFKGVQEPTPAFVVVGERALESRFATRQAGGMAPIVGRDQELALLPERWQQAKSGEGQMVLLTGEAGIGSHGSPKLWSRPLPASHISCCATNARPTMRTPRFTR
jgi:hypothetical protein